jgi:hypothetical protein
LREHRTLLSQSVARSVKATACMTCIALMGLEFTCYDPRTIATT